MTAPTTHRLRSNGSLVVLLALACLWILWGISFATAADHNASGQCEGLGWGCTLTPRDFAEFAAVIVLAPLSVLVLVVTLVVRLWRTRRGAPRTVWDVVVGAILLAVAALWFAGAVAGAF